MGWFQVAVLIALTLTAGTLPSGGAAAPAAPVPVERPASPPATHDVPGTPHRVPGKTAPEGGLLLQAAPSIEGWRSASARPCHGLGSHQLIALAADRIAHAWRPSPSALRALRSGLAGKQEQARAWLTCRYPNAPPAA